MKAAAVLLLVPALLAGCLAGGHAPAPAPTGQVDGAVVDHLLNPYANQTVTLVQLQRTDQTSPLGGFTFRDVPVGFYTVTTSLDGVTDTQVVDVEAGKVTRVILQLVPPHKPAPYFQAFAFDSPGERPEAGSPCSSCTWSVALDERRPAEVTLDAAWAPGPLGEDNDVLSIRVAGADIHPEARGLRVEVAFGPRFMPNAQEFTMRSVMTLYHGATKAEMYGVVA